MKHFTHTTSLALAAALVAFGATGAHAANGRSYSGTVTNNQTYNAGNLYDESSADRSDVNLRPLAIDPHHNRAKESAVNVHSTTVVSPAVVAAPAVVVPSSTVVGTTRVYSNEPTHLAPAGTVTTTTYTTPAWHDPADVNARPDAGVIVTYPVLPAPTATTVVTTDGAVVGGY